MSEALTREQFDDMIQEFRNGNEPPLWEAIAAQRQEIARLTADLEREVGNVNAALATRDEYQAKWRQAEQERDAFIRGGVTEELLRKNDGYLKVGKGCILVREDDWREAQKALSRLIEPATPPSSQP